MNRDVKTMLNWAHRQIGDGFNVPSSVLAANDRLFAPKRRVRKSLAPGRMKPTNEELDAETARLRVRAMHRSEGRGELCGRIFDPDTVQFCHLDGGSGKRRRDQWIGNVLMEHPECHNDGPDSLDRRPEAWLPEVKRFCAKYGYPLPERFRRLQIKAQHRQAARSLRHEEG